MSGTSADPVVIDDVVVTADRPTTLVPVDNTVSVIIAGQTFSGWQSVRISRSLERMPPNFDLIATERNPGTGALALLPPGASCQIKIGADLVLTGYVDRYLPSISAKHHHVQIRGRGICQDLVDCSVVPDIINGMQITTSTLVDLARRLVAKFGAPPPLKVKSLTGNDVPVVANKSGAPLVFNATLQETPYEILEKVARYVGVLIYEDTDGTLLIANVGASKMASGFSQGVNVQAAAAFTRDER